MTPDVPTGYPVLSGETLVVPILGDPIAQVKSPDGVTRALVARGRDAVVVPMHVLPDDLDTVIRGLGPVRSIAGLIATVPHKFGARRALRHPDRPRRLPRLGQRRPAQPRPHLVRRPGRRRRVRRRLPGERPTYVRGADAARRGSS